MSLDAGDLISSFTQSNDPCVRIPLVLNHGGTVQSCACKHGVLGAGTRAKEQSVEVKS
jgi:hypothetical protein